MRANNVVNSQRNPERQELSSISLPKPFTEIMSISPASGQDFSYRRENVKEEEVEA